MNDKAEKLDEILDEIAEQMIEDEFVLVTNSGANYTTCTDSSTYYETTLSTDEESFADRTMTKEKPAPEIGIQDFKTPYEILNGPEKLIQDHQKLFENTKSEDITEEQEIESVNQTSEKLEQSSQLPQKELQNTSQISSIASTLSAESIASLVENEDDQESKNLQSLVQEDSELLDDVNEVINDTKISDQSNNDDLKPLATEETNNDFEISEFPEQSLLSDAKNSEAESVSILSDANDSTLPEIENLQPIENLSKDQDQNQNRDQTQNNSVKKNSLISNQTETISEISSIHKSSREDTSILDVTGGQNDGVLDEYLDDFE